MVPFGYDRCSCISVNSSFTLITPTISGDVKCSVVIRPNSGDCFNVAKECSEFIDALNITTKPFFSICRDRKESSRFQMCFGNVTEELNGIKIYITSATTRCDEFIRRYNQGIIIQLQGI